MADIIDPAVRKFANEKLRVMADMVEQTRRTGEQFLIDVAAEFESLTSGNASGDVIVDGAATDGRSIITKQSVGEVKYVVEQLVACLNQDDRETLIANVSVNGTPRF